MPMKWINKPPIVAVTGKEVVTMTSQLIKNIKDVYADVELEDWVLDFYGKTDAWNNANGYRGFDADVVSDSGTMMNIFGHTSEYDNYFVYKVNGAPVAVMQMAVENDCVKINSLLVNPLASGGAGAMVEFAINQKDWGSKTPTVKLFALGSAEAAYRGIGFIDDGGDMKLDLSKDNPKWHSTLGEWHYVPTDGSVGYLSTFHGKPPPVPPKPKSFSFKKT